MEIDIISEQSEILSKKDRIYDNFFDIDDVSGEIANKYADEIRKIASLKTEYKDLDIDFYIEKMKERKLEVINFKSSQNKFKYTNLSSFFAGQIYLYTKIRNMFLKGDKDLTPVNKDIETGLQKNENDEHLMYFDDFLMWVYEFPKIISELNVQVAKTIIILQNTEFQAIFHNKKVDLFKKDLFNILTTTLNELKAIRISVFDIILSFKDSYNGKTDTDTIVASSNEDFIVDNVFSVESSTYDTYIVMERLVAMSTEDEKIENFNPENPDEGIFNRIINTMKSVPSRINRLNKKVRLFRTKAVNYRFYRKYLGRIDHMYERYADEAVVVENKMIGDPVKILKNEAQAYIDRVSNDIVGLYEEISKLSKRISKMDNAKQALAEVNLFLGDDKVPFEKIKRLPKSMVKACKRRLAKSILTDNDVYGYTVESITEKKFPPANHVITSLFVRNAQETPKEQAVSDVITSVDSFKLIASNEKQPIFDVTQMANNLISNGIQPKDIKEIKMLKATGMSNLKAGLDSANKNIDKNEKQGLERLNEQTKYIWKGLESSLGYVASMKDYTFQLINGYFEMMIRVDNLCKKCVKSLLVVERMKKDERYDTGFKGSKLNSHKKYQSHDENYTTKGEKEVSKAQQHIERREERAQRIKEIREEFKQLRRHRG